MMDEADLTETDRAILDVLARGARTKKAIVDETELHRNTVGNRLAVLEAGDVVRCLHETTALYELVADPRGGAGGSGTVDVEQIEREFDEIERALEEGESERVRDAVERARDGL